MPIEDAVNFMKQAAQKSYGKKGQDVVDGHNVSQLEESGLQDGIGALAHTDVYKRQQEW